MKLNAKLVEQALGMTASEPVEIDQGLHQMVHDVQNCLHVIGMGAERLRDVRDDDAKFAEAFEGIDRGRREAVRLLRDYLQSTHDGQ